MRAMMKRAASLLVLTVLTAALAACGNDEVPQVKPGSADAPVVDESTPAPSGPSSDDLQTFFEALADLKGPKVEAALKVAAPGSLAELYLMHQAALEQAYVDSGNPSDPDTLTEKDGAYISCGADESGDDCAIWDDLAAEGDKIASFTTNGQALDGRILAGGKRLFRAGDLGEARLISAYVTSIGDLWVILDIKNTSARPISVESRTSYRSKDGRQAAVGVNASPTSLLPDSLASYALYVEGGKLGGTLHLEMFTESGGGDNGVADIPIRQG